jgi:hypothetical protein
LLDADPAGSLLPPLDDPLPSAKLTPFCELTLPAPTEGVVLND